MADQYLGFGKDRVELVDIENIEDLNARIVRKRRTRPRIGAGKEDDIIARFREKTFGESVEVIERPDLLSPGVGRRWRPWRSEEHTSELQSLMRISYAVFCLKKKTTKKDIAQNDHVHHSENI